MAEYSERENFIPIRKSDVVTLLCRDDRLKAGEQEPFREFAEILGAMFHFRFHERLESLKSAYHPFNPDADTIALRPQSEREHEGKLVTLLDEFHEVLADANFVEMTEQEVNAALDESSGAWTIELHVDFSEFEHLRVYSRGLSPKTRMVRSWKRLFLQRPLQVMEYDRLAMLIKFKAPEDKRRARRRNFSHEKVYLKLFKDIPKEDLEMLFPNTSIRMRGIDKLKISLPMILGVGLTLVKLAPFIVLALIASFKLDKLREFMEVKFPALVDDPTGQGLSVGLLIAAVAALGGYLFKSVKGYFNTKTRYIASLTSNLYFLNLDNNAGVLQHLVDTAEEEEVKEALLAYFFLTHAAPPEGDAWTERSLDDAIESWIEVRTSEADDPRHVDFEIDDAVDKLERLNVVVDEDNDEQKAAVDAALRDTLQGSKHARWLDLSTWTPFVREEKDEDGQWHERPCRVAPLAVAKIILDYDWDHYFSYNGAADEDESGVGGPGTGVGPHTRVGEPSPQQPRLDASHSPPSRDALPERVRTEPRRDIEKTRDALSERQAREFAATKPGERLPPQPRRPAEPLSWEDEPSECAAEPIAADFQDDTSALDAIEAEPIEAQAPKTLAAKAGSSQDTDADGLLLDNGDEIRIEEYSAGAPDEEFVDDQEETDPGA